MNKQDVVEAKQWLERYIASIDDSKILSIESRTVCNPPPGSEDYIGPQPIYVTITITLAP